MGQALDDGRLAHSRLTYQDRIVLGPSRQDLDGRLYLLCPADDRVKLADAGHLGQIAGELVQSGRLHHRNKTFLASPADRLYHCVLHFLVIKFLLFQNPGTQTFAFGHQSQKQMFRSDIAVAQTLGLGQSQVEYPFHARGELQLCLGADASLDAFLKV